MVDGEVHLQWTMGPSRGRPLAGITRPLATAGRTRVRPPTGRGLRPPTGPGASTESVRPEDGFAQLLASLPEHGRKQLAELRAAKPPGPHWFPAQATKLTAPPIDFRTRSFAGGVRSAGGVRIGNKPSLGRIEVVPNAHKRLYYQKLDEIINEASRPVASH